MSRYEIGTSGEDSFAHSRAELMLAVSGIAMRGDWDPSGATIDKIRALALEAAENPQLELFLDERGEPSYQSYLMDLDLRAGDRRRGRLAMNFREGTFSGISVDARELGKKHYFLYPDSELVTISNDNREHKVGRLAGRFMFGQVRSLRPAFVDPQILAKYFARYGE